MCVYVTEAMRQTLQSGSKLQCALIFENTDDIVGFNNPCQRDFMDLYIYRYLVYSLLIVIVLAKTGNFFFECRILLFFYLMKVRVYNRKRDNIDPIHLYARNDISEL